MKKVEYLSTNQSYSGKFQDHDIDNNNEWQPSLLTPLEAVLPKELGISHEQLQLFDKTMFALSGGESKAAVFVHGLSQNNRNIHEVYRKLKDVMPPKTWIPKYLALTKYIEKSFLPTGFVNEEGNENFHWFHVADIGSRIAKPVAAYLLRYSAESDIVASEIFKSGATADDGKRTYVNRSAVLLYLYSNKTHKTRLMQITGLGPSSSKVILHDFRNLGLIDYEYADPETPGWGVYERVGEPDVVSHSQTRNRLRRNMIEYFLINQISNPQTIAEALGRVDIIDVHKIASQLVEDGFLQRKEWHGGVVQSKAEIREEGKLFVDEVLLPILKFFARDPQTINQFEKTLREVESNPSISAQAIKNYKEFKYKVPRDKTSESIVNLIREKGPQRPQQILAVFGKRAEPVILDLLKKGRVNKKRGGKAVFYFFPAMEKPVQEKTVTLFEYKKPESLLPPTCYPKERYLSDLETKEFWQGLLSDLNQIHEKAATEAVFFSDYKPDNPSWQEKEDYHAGKYLNYMIALRKFGIRNPYAFLRNYQPSLRDSQLNSLIKETQNLMKAKLIESKQLKHWREYLKDFHTIRFWQGLVVDMDRAPKGLSFFQFLAFFSDSSPVFYDRSVNGKYYPIYLNARLHTGNGITYLRDFIPTLPHSKKTEELISKAQEIIKNKFTFNRTRRYPEEWAEVFEDPEFWEEFERDVARCPEAETFYNFLVHFDEDNTDLSVKKQPSGKMQLGKYYLLTYSEATHEAMRSEMPYIENLPKEVINSENSIVKPYVYAKASPSLRKLLLQKFPAEFRPVARILAEFSAKKELLFDDAIILGIDYAIRNQDSKNVPFLRRLQAMYNPSKLRDISTLDIGALKKLARKIPLDSNRVNFEKLGVSPYMAKLVSLITSVEYDGIKSFNPDDIVICSVFKEELLTCIDLLEERGKNMDLVELFKIQVKKGLKSLSNS